MSVTRSKLHGSTTKTAKSGKTMKDSRIKKYGASVGVLLVPSSGTRSLAKMKSLADSADCLTAGHNMTGSGPINPATSKRMEKTMSLHEFAQMWSEAYDASESAYLDNLPQEPYDGMRGEQEPPEPELFSQTCACGREYWIEINRVELLDPRDNYSTHFFDGRECKRLTAEQHEAADRRMWREAYG
jgi:hypothetical protein